MLSTKVYRVYLCERPQRHSLWLKCHVHFPLSPSGLRLLFTVTLRSCLGNDVRHLADRTGNFKSQGLDFYQPQL